MALDLAALILMVARRDKHAKNILGAMSMPKLLYGRQISTYVKKERQLDESASLA